MSYIGTYERTIFYNPSNKYCIIRVKSSDQSIPQQARSAYRHRDNMIRFIAVGYELPQTDKVSMILDGEWESGKHGVQLQVERCEEIVPQTKEGVFGYLSSRLIKGVGEKTAALIVSRFGADALRVLEKEPERLLEIRGITPDKLEDIKASYAESRCVRDLMILLTPFNVTPTTAMKIYEHFGSRSVDILQKNPYELCQVSGFGFKRVDAIVRKGTVPLNSPMRIHGAVFAALDTQRSEKGHLYLDETALTKVSVKLLNENTPDGQIKVTPEEVDAVIQDMILKGEIVSSNGNIYQINCFIQEDETARKIAEMLAVPPVELDISDSLEFVRKNLGIALSQRQSEAVYMAFRSNLSIITGSPGTGKTTVLRAIIEVFQMLYPKGKIMLAAPTGRASRRMAESTGRNEAKTLHSLLGLLGDSEPINKDKQKEPLDADLIIVDESSMIDMWLARQFFQRIRPGTRVILVGDVDQLQSVGAGDVFRELIDSGLIPVITHNASAIEGIPLQIPYKERLVVVGESFIRNSDFEWLRETLVDSTGKPYKNSRNLAAGSVRAYSSAVCAQRCVHFLPFAVIEGLPEIEAETDSKRMKLAKITEYGFGRLRSIQFSTADSDMMELHIKVLRDKAKEDDLPIDGLVITYDSISYSGTCGRTGHHFKDGLAFKFEDDLFKTRLDHIEWTPTRSGEISPVAVFDTVEIDGCEVSRATLHNLSFIEGLELMPGNRILVSKRNMIIPQVEENLDRGGFCMEDLVPSLCPCCGYQTMVHTTKKRVNGELKLTKTLFCHNPNCASQNLRKFVHFVSKKAMDIEGLSEATLEQFIDRGWLLDFTDIYRLDQHREEIIRMDGFGEKSWQRLWNAIQKSRNTSFERYLIAMDIPMIGSTASSALGSCFDWSLRAFEVAVDTGYDFTQIPDFGETLQNNIFEWFSIEENRILWEELKDMVSIEKKETNISEVQDNPFVGKTLVVTGKVEPYTRDGINAKIASLGAKAGSSVSKNTDYLICGENAGSKLTKAQSLGVTVLSPAEFFSMIGE